MSELGRVSKNAAAGPERQFDGAVGTSDVGPVETEDAFVGVTITAVAVAVLQILRVAFLFAKRLAPGVVALECPAL